MRITGAEVIEYDGLASDPNPSAAGTAHSYFNTVAAALRESESGLPFENLLTSVAALYDDRSTNYTSTLSATDVPLLRQNGGAEFGFDLGPWRDGNRLLLWIDVTIITISASGDNVIFTPRIERTSGDIVLASFGDSYSPQFYGSCSAFYVVGPLNSEATLRFRCNWRTRFGSGTAEIDPDGSSTAGFPASALALAAQVRLG